MYFFKKHIIKIEIALLLLLLLILGLSGVSYAFLFSDTVFLGIQIDTLWFYLFSPNLIFHQYPIAGWVINVIFYLILLIIPITGFVFHRKKLDAKILHLSLILLAIAHLIFFAFLNFVLMALASV